MSAPLAAITVAANIYQYIDLSEQVAPIQATTLPLSLEILTYPVVHEATKLSLAYRFRHPLQYYIITFKLISAGLVFQNVKAYSR